MSEFANWYTDLVDSENDWSAMGYCTCGSEGYHLDCQMRTAALLKDEAYIDSLFDELGYKAVASSKEFAKAEEIILQSLNMDPSRDAYPREKVLESPSTFYFPICWIGCTGYLVIKGGYDIVPFGSYIGMREHIWAYHQGITLAAQGKDRYNTLTMTEISDPVNTSKVLKRFLDGRYVIREVEPKYSQLPIVLKDVDLYFAIRDLIWAQRYNWFQFSIK